MVIKWQKSVLSICFCLDISFGKYLHFPFFIGSAVVWVPFSKRRYPALAIECCQCDSEGRVDCCRWWCFCFCRWEILSEIIQAQNLRLSRPLQESEPPREKAESNMHHHEDPSLPPPSGAAVETPRTKRKMATSTKRIQFETSYAKALPIADRIGESIIKFQ